MSESRLNLNGASLADDRVELSELEESPDCDIRQQDSVTGTADEADDLVQEYMADFFKRHQIAQANTTPAPNDTTREDTRSTTGPDEEIQAVPRVADDAPPSLPGDPSDEESLPADASASRQRVAALESRDRLHALRQLANTTARGALKTHFHRRSITRLRTYLIVGMLAATASVAAVILAPDPQSWSYRGAVALLVVAVVSCVRYLTLARAVADTPGRTSQSEADTNAAVGHAEADTSNLG